MKQFIQNIIVFHVNLLKNVIIQEGSSIIWMMIYLSFVASEGMIFRRRQMHIIKHYQQIAL